MANQKTARTTFEEEHLFADHVRMINMGLYKRLSDLSGVNVSLSDSQRERLNRALKTELSDDAFLSIASMASRLVEHELIIVRAPPEENVLSEIDKICSSAIETLNTLDELQATYNLSTFTSPVRFTLAEPRGCDTRAPLRAKEAAINLIKRDLREPIQTPPALFSFVKTCWALKERLSRKVKGGKSPVYFTLFLFCLFNVAKNSGKKVTLPSKDAKTLRDGSPQTTDFLTFVQEAIKIADEIADLCLKQSTITAAERSATLQRFRAYRSLSNTQLRLRLDNIRKGKVPGLLEFAAEATRVHGST